MDMDFLLKTVLFQMKQHNSIFQACIYHCMLLCKKPVLSMMFNSICSLKTVPEHFSEIKIKYFHTIFCITGAYIKLLVQKVHLIVAEPLSVNIKLFLFLTNQYYRVIESK